VGNPNAGKTTVFNALTGSFQKVGNYPGVTVESTEGFFTHEGTRFRVVDVPGLYSTDAISQDEQVAIDVVKGIQAGAARPDLLVYVLDANNLERNLFLFSQLAELKIPIVCALTMTDVVSQGGETIDVESLATELSVPVVPVIGHKSRGISNLKHTILASLEKPPVATTILRERMLLVRDSFARAGYDYTLDQLEEAIADPDGKLMRESIDFPETHELLAAARAKAIDATERYRWAERIRRSVVAEQTGRKRRRSDSLDRILTHRVYGLAVFVGIMYLIFQSIYSFAAPLMDLIEAGLLLLPIGSAQCWLRTKHFSHSSLTASSQVWDPSSSSSRRF
jgi:ferrous iron transport protein B